MEESELDYISNNLSPIPEKLSIKSEISSEKESEHLGQVFDAIFNNHYLKPILANVLPEEIEPEEMTILRIWTAPIVTSNSFKISAIVRDSKYKYLFT